jgi:hypothetical protein
MARRRQSCHASLARCSQNPRCHIACRQGAGRLSTKADPGAGYPVGYRPSVDRTCPSIGCCRSRDRRRSISPGRQAGICLSIVFPAKPSRMIPRPRGARKSSICCRSEQRPATARRGSEATGLAGCEGRRNQVLALLLLTERSDSKRRKQVPPPGTDRPTAHDKA